MPSSYNMNLDGDLYRGILEYDYQDYEWVRDPSKPDHLTWNKVRVPVGPVVPTQFCVGPYHSPTPIKAFVTSSRASYTNLRLLRIEKVSGWEEVDG